MLIAEQCFIDCINSPVRNVKARVELLDGSTLINIFKYTDRLKSFSIERTGEGKFFGYGVCQKINVKLIDKDRELNITTANTLNIAFGVDYNYIYPFPVFKVSEVHRDENTNELSITAYDFLYQATYHTVSELLITAPYTIREFATACASLLEIPLAPMEFPEADLSYPNGANFDGAESIREALNDIAEATQTIYYINHDWELTFKRLDIDGDAVLTIDKSKYFTLSSKTNRRLSAICHTVELGDNVIAELDKSGSTQYIRDNAFWSLREDIGTLIDNALATVGNLTINQFNMEWRGNYLLEIGDKIALVTKDNDIVFAYLLNDSITYDGSLKQVSQWNYDSDELETESNPTSLGDILKQTYARVDKQQKRITLLVSGQEKNTTDITQLKLDRNSINASVSTIVNTQTDLSETIAEIQNGISEQNVSNTKQFETLTKKVEATMTSDDIQLTISNELAKGTDKVTTSTGFTFNDEGLTISKSDSEMSTNIDEDGMSIFKGSEEVLTANNTGVDAQNLHATTYLIIGTNSRFEDYGSDRTGCFWIGS